VSAEDKIRKLCSQLLSAPEDSAKSRRIFAELKTAHRELGEHLKTTSNEFRQREWKKPSESDRHQDEARQPYRSRERASGDGFGGDGKSRNAKQSDSEEESN